MDRTLLTAREVADLLRLNVDTIYKLVQREGLPAVKIGGQWRFWAAEVRGWVRGQRGDNTHALSRKSRKEDTQGRGSAPSDAARTPWHGRGVPYAANARQGVATSGNM